MNAKMRCERKVCYGASPVHTNYFFHFESLLRLRLCFWRPPGRIGPKHYENPAGTGGRSESDGSVTGVRRTPDELPTAAFAETFKNL